MKEVKIENLVVLGRSAPEPIKDGRHTVCLAGWSMSGNRFVRIYPTKINSPVRRWDIINIPAIKDKSHDPRKESYKIQGSKSEWDHLENKINKVGRLKGRKRVKLLKEIPTGCTVSLNNNKKSLGLIKATELKPYLVKNNTEDKQNQCEVRGKNGYPYELRIKYQHNNCLLKGDYHDQHCIEWGVYRYWDKTSQEKHSQVIDNLQLSNNDYTKYFLIGNQRYHFHSFLIISVLRFKENNKTPLFQ